MSQFISFFFVLLYTPVLRKQNGSKWTSLYWWHTMLKKLAKHLTFVKPCIYNSPPPHPPPYAMQLILTGNLTHQCSWNLQPLQTIHSNQGYPAWWLLRKLLPLMLMWWRWTVSHNWYQSDPYQMPCKKKRHMNAFLNFLEISHHQIYSMRAKL